MIESTVEYLLLDYAVEYPINISELWNVENFD